ncbi:MAG: hypothetical protein DMF22_00925 [Verrucomicrobia bacterium]|nr:MAG: hypothetical protein DMF22_00925 [Verrucomicrobiota bacterium]
MRSAFFWHRQDSCTFSETIVCRTGGMRGPSNQNLVSLLLGFTGRVAHPVRSIATRPMLPSQLYLNHSHCPVLAPATLAALPSTHAIPGRDVF